MKTIKLIVEIECEDDIKNVIIKHQVSDILFNSYYFKTKVYEYTEPVEELKPNRP